MMPRKSAGFRNTVLQSVQSRSRRVIAKAVLLGCVAVAVAATVVVGVAQSRTDTTPESFLPANDRTLRGLQETARSFGGDPIIVLAETQTPRELPGEGQQLQRLMALEGQLSRLPDVAVVYGPGTVVNQIATSARGLMASLSGKRDAIRKAAEQRVRSAGAGEQEAANAGNSAVAKFDRRYGALLVRGLPAGLPTVNNPRFVNSVIFDRDGEPRPQWRFLVPSTKAVAIHVRPREGLDQEGTDRLATAVRTTVESSGLKTSRLTVTGTPAVASGLAERVKQEVPVLGGLAVAGIAASYLLFPWTRRKRHRLLPLVTTLGATAVTLAAFGWLDRPLSLGVVAFLPILVGIGSDFPAYLVHGAQRRRVVATALAAAAGFASLAVSPLPFVRDLGLALAVGVLLSLLLAILFRKFLAPTQPASEDGSDVGRQPATAGLSRTKRLVMLGVVAVVSVGGWFGLAHLPVKANPEQLADGLPAVQDAQHAQGILESSGEVQVVLRGKNVLTPEAFAWMRQAEETTILNHGDQLRPIISLPGLLEFLGPAPTQAQIAAGVEQLPSYITGSVVRSDSQKAMISLGLELQDLGSQRQLLNSLQRELPEPPAGFEAEVTGLPVAAARGYALISGERYLPSLVGILAAGLVLLIGLSRRSDAMRAVLAAVLAAGWALAGLWLLGIPLTPLTAALGSLATATACEFTVLLGRAYETGRPSRRTVRVVALAASVGYLALTVSGLAIIREFGFVLAGTVGLSYIAAHAVVRLLPTRTDRPTHSTDVRDTTTRTEVAV